MAGEILQGFLLAVGLNDTSAQRYISKWQCIENIQRNRNWQKKKPEKPSLYRVKSLLSLDPPGYSCSEYYLDPCDNEERFSGIFFYFNNLQATETCQCWA